MNINKAKEIVISIFNSSCHRKTTELEMKSIKKITKMYGDNFVQSCYIEAAGANLNKQKLKVMELNGNTYKERCDNQLEEWVKGISIHNTKDEECCPDFSCCKPEFL